LRRKELLIERPFIGLREKIDVRSQSMKAQIWNGMPPLLEISAGHPAAKQED